MTIQHVWATHNASRYFPFLERPEQYIIKNRTQFTPSFFYIGASSSLRRGGSTGGIPELWGPYNLKDVIASLQNVNPSANPVYDATGNNDYQGKSIAYRVRGHVSGYGINLIHEQDLKWHGFQIGASLPVIHLHTTSKYAFDRNNSDAIFNSMFLTDYEKEKQRQQVDKIRRLTHDMLNFTDNEWEKNGFGDLDLHLRWNHIFDHVILMRSIDTNLQIGVIAPTGITSNANYPQSLSFSNNGHWAIYGDWVTAFELKPDWTVGLMLGFEHLFKNTRTLRLAYNQEPTVFSGLIGKVSIDPGFTFKFSPYFTLGNLTDGLDFQFRYTYLRHGKDNWKDVRNDKSIPSYLTQGNDSVVQYKKDLSKWSGHYATFQMTYDTKVAMKCHRLDPVFFMTVDMPIQGNGICQTYQVTLGSQLRF